MTDPSDDVELRLAAALREPTESDQATPDPAALRRSVIARRRADARRRRVWLPVGVAATVAAIAAATALYLLPEQGSAPPAPAEPSPTARASGSHSVTGTAAPGPSSSIEPAARPAPCTAAQLRPSVDTSRTGPTAGTENVVLRFENTGVAPCWLTGLPALTATTASGKVVPLHFHASSDPAVADPDPVAGPGAVAPHQFGALHLTVGLPPACTRSLPHYAALHIKLRAGQIVSLPYPSQLALGGCLGYEGPIGPATAASAGQSSTGQSTPATQRTGASFARQVALPGAWQQALKSSSYSLDGVSTIPLAMTADGGMIAARDLGTARDVVAITPGKAVRTIFTIPDPGEDQVLGASVDGSWVLLPVSRLPRHSDGVDETVVRIDLVNLSSGVHREIAHTSQADAVNGGETIGGAVIYRGHVYFDTRPTYASAARVINDYDIADGITTVVTSATAGEPESMPQLSAAGVAWTTTANKTAAVTDVASLPPIVASAIADAAGHIALSTDGSAYAWFAGHRTIGWWAPGDPAARYITLPNTDQWSSASFGQYDQPTVAGQYVFLEGYVIDMHTGAGAVINTFGGHARGAFGIAPQSSSHGIVLGYAATGSTNQTFEVLRLDTTKLPDIKSAR